MYDGLVHIAAYDGLVHTPDSIVAGPPGHFEASPPGHARVGPPGHTWVGLPGHVTVPTPPADQVIHVINEGITGHIINELV